jgi:hypothetical protein
MRFHWRNYDTGWGELTCFVLAWVIGLAGIWFDYAGRPHANDKVAVSGGRGPSPTSLD